MNMIFQFLDIFLKLCESIPGVGAYLSIAAQIALGITTVISSVVAIWKAVAELFKSLGSIFHSDKLLAIGNALSVSEEKLKGIEESYIIPILNRFSVIPLPKVKDPFKMNVTGDPR